MGRYISTIKTAVQALSFSGILLTLPLHDSELSKGSGPMKLRVADFQIFFYALPDDGLSLVILPLGSSKIHTSYSEMVNLHFPRWLVVIFKALI